MNTKNFVIRMQNILLEKVSLADSLNKAEKLGKLLWHNNLGIYSLPTLEIDLFKKSEYLLERLSSTSIQKKKSVLFIGSEIYLTGGHTRLMERLASFLDPKPDLYLTRAVKDEAVVRIKSFFNSVEKYELSGSKDIELALIKFVEKIITYEKIVLNIHPDDIYSVVACLLAKKVNANLKFYFVNHADHVFGYGVSVSDIWFEISSFGKMLDLARSPDLKKSFLGIPLDLNPDSFTTSYSQFRDGDNILTSGSSNKFKPIHNVSIIKSIHNLLNQYPNSTLNVVGCKPLRDYWWWRTKLKFGARIKLISSLPYDEYIDLSEKSVAYLDSHPLPGGTAFIEQYLKGKICIGLISPIQGYSPVERLKHYSLESVNKVLSCEGNLKFDAAMKDQIIKVHALGNVKDRFLGTLFKDNIYDNLCLASNEWTGDIHFLEEKEINNIPSSYDIFDGFTYQVMKFSSKKAKIGFFLKKLFNKMRKLRA